MRLFLIFLSLLCSSVFAQNAIRGPLSGFVYDRSSRAIRPIRGVPGAAYLGAPILQEVDSATVAPGGKWAFASTGGKSTFWTHLDSAPVRQELPNLIDKVEGVAISRHGRYAAFWSDRLLQRVHLVENSFEAEIPLLATGAIKAAATNDAGDIAVSTAEGVYLWQSTASSAALISTAAEASFLSWSADGRIAYALTKSELLAYEPDSKVLTARSISDSDIDPVGLGVAEPEGALYVADRATSRLLVIQKDGQRTSLDLDAPPSGLSLVNSQIHLLNPSFRDREPLFIVDSRSGPQVLLIPAPPVE